MYFIDVLRFNEQRKKNNSTVCAKQLQLDKSFVYKQQSSSM